MRKSRFTDEQIVAMLRETDRDAVPVVAIEPVRRSFALLNAEMESGRRGQADSTATRMPLPNLTQSRPSAGCALDDEC